MPRACTTASKILLSGQGIPFDHQQARELAEKACAMGHLEGCATLSSILSYYPREPGVTLHTRASLDLAALACQGDVSSACEMLVADDLVYRAHERALQTQTNTCTLTGRGCEELTLIKAIAQQSRQGDEELLAWHKDRCLHTDQLTSCKRYIDLAHEKRIQAPSITFNAIGPSLRRRCIEEDDHDACTLYLDYDLLANEALDVAIADAMEEECATQKNYHVCEQLVLSYTHDYWTRGKSTASDEAMRRAITLEEVACHEGRAAAACAALAYFTGGYSKARSGETACALGVFDLCDLEQDSSTMTAAELLAYRDLLAKSCRATLSGKGCEELARLYEDLLVPGPSPRESYQEALSILEYDCESNNFSASSCARIASYYRDEEKHTRADRSTHERYATRACLELFPVCEPMFQDVQGTATELYQKYVDALDQLSRLKKQRAAKHTLYSFHVPPHDKRKEQSARQTLHNALLNTHSDLQHCEQAEESCRYIQGRFNDMLEIPYEQDRLDCEAGDAEACYFRGWLNLKSIGALQADEKEYVPYLVKGCELGNFSACETLTQPPIINQEGSSPRTLEAARRGCELIAALDLSGDERRMELPPVCKVALASSPDEATIKLVQETCDSSNVQAHSYCHEDIDEALLKQATTPATFEYFRMRCEEDGDLFACERHARDLYPGSPDAASQQARALCQEHARCTEHGRQLTLTTQGRGEGVLLLTRMCFEDLSPLACWELAHIPSTPNAPDVLEQGCALWHGASCLEVGRHYEAKGGEEATSKAARYLRRARLQDMN